MANGQQSAGHAAMIAQLRASSAGTPPPPAAGTTPPVPPAAAPQRNRPPRPTPPPPPPPPSAYSPTGTLPAPRRRGTPMPRRWLGFFLGVVLTAFGLLFIAMLLGYGLAPVQFTGARFLNGLREHPVSQFGDRPWERPAKPTKPAPKEDLAVPAPPAPTPAPVPAPTPAPPCNCTSSAPAPTGPPINVSHYAPSPVPQPTVVYQPQPAPRPMAYAPRWQGYGQRPNLPPSQTAFCYPGTPGCRLYVQPGGAEVWLPY